MTDPTDISARREAWRYKGGDRPDSAVGLGPGQESVWDYPRPPAFYLPSEAAVSRYPASLPGAESIAGWVTDELVGPWKGEAGTGHW